MLNPSKVNESLQEMLRKKTHHEGRAFKFKQLLDFLATLRQAMAGNKFEKILTFKSKITKL